MDPKRAASSSSLSKWGLVQGWLVGDPARKVEVRASPFGLAVTVFDPKAGEHRAEIRATEDPSAAAWRAIVMIDRDR